MFYGKAGFKLEKQVFKYGKAGFQVGRSLNNENSISTKTKGCIYDSSFFKDSIQICVLFVYFIVFFFSQ